MRFHGVRATQGGHGVRATQAGHGGPVLELIHVVKSYGSVDTEVRALTDVSMAVEAGEFVALRGPSGCGRSTLGSGPWTRSRPSG